MVNRMYNKTKWWGILIYNRLGLRGSLAQGYLRPSFNIIYCVYDYYVYYNNDDDNGDDNDDDDNTIPAHY